MPAGIKEQPYDSSTLILPCLWVRACEPERSMGSRLEAEADQQKSWAPGSQSQPKASKKPTGEDIYIYIHILLFFIHDIVMLCYMAHKLSSGTSTDSAAPARRRPEARGLSESSSGGGSPGLFHSCNLQRNLRGP